jgi:hypothetical protein
VVVFCGQATDNGENYLNHEFDSMKFAGVFIKFGNKNHLLQLQKKGLLYCNTVTFFSQLENDKVRGDKLETAVELDYIENGILEIKPKDIQNAKTLSFSIKEAKFISSRADPFGNLFCLHAINVLDKKPNEIFKIDPRNKAFGDYFLLITNTKEFLERLKAGLNTYNYDYSYDMVEYLDFSKYKGRRTIFQKDMINEYQAEFRLFIYNKSSEAIQIEIGDISDISILYNSDTIDSFSMKFQEKI